MNQALEFANLLRVREILELEYQPVIVLLPKPNLVKYIPDFRVVWRNGNEEYVDVKGVETPAFRLKVKMLRHFYPNLKLVITKKLYEQQEIQETSTTPNCKANRKKDSKKAGR